MLSDIATVTLEDVRAAARRIAGAVVETPLVESRIGGRRLWLKCESLQTGGAFKLRGASNRLLQLSPEQRARGVVAFSSGNHAQGVAIAARRLGIRAVIVMPSDAPALKIEGTRAHGAEIRHYDRLTEDRVAIASAIASDSGATVVPAFDDPHVIAGQGTVGLEILAQLHRVGAPPPPRIVVNCGGGGLAAGISLACPDAAITVVEPHGWDDMVRSLDEGRILPVDDPSAATLCDALQTLIVSPITFAILADRGVDCAVVSDDEVRLAMRWAWMQHGLTVEPGGAASIAAILAGKAKIEDGSVAILSGGNVDPAVHAQIVAQT